MGYEVGMVILIGAYTNSYEFYNSLAHFSLLFVSRMFTVP